MNTTVAMLLNRGIIVTDGSWGTQLQKKGPGSGIVPDSLNITDPGAVEKVARYYVDAGSDIILTNTFSANRFVLAKYNLADDVEAINRAGVAISKKAAGSRALVFASIGPSGKMLMNGDVTEEELKTAFEEQARALANAGADGLVVETMMDIVEASIAVAAAKSTGLPVVGCMVFDTGKDRMHTMMGNTPEEAITALSVAGADVVGANCGLGIESFIPLCQRMKAATAKPLWMKPNAGLPEMEGAEVVYRTTPAIFARHVPDLINAGASFIGGCCGTNREYIIEIKKCVENMKLR